MKVLSENDYVKMLEEIEEKNEGIQRYLDIKEEKSKFSPLKRFMNKVSTSNKVLLTSIIAIVLYSIIYIILQCKCGIEINDTFTVAYFGFWGVELINLASIKNTKTKNQDDDVSDEEVIDEEEIIEEENEE